MSFVPALAQDGRKLDSPKSERRSTFASVRALANTSRPALADLDRRDVAPAPGDVRDVPDKPKEKNDAAENPKPREAKPKARNDARERAPVERERKPAAEQVRKQAQRRAQDEWARQQGGIAFQPWGGDPRLAGWGNAGWGNAGWGNAGWGNAGWGNGVGFNQITGYRSFRYSGYGNGYYYPVYGNGYGYGGYGFGFSPVAFGITGGVTTRYADPVGRQHKMMDESIRKFAEGR
jgi:hypothetical protein